MRCVGVHLAPDEIAVGEDLVHRALKLADVRGDILSDVLGDIVVYDRAPLRGLVLHDGKARFKVGRLHVDQQAPLEARAQAVVQKVHLGRRSIRRQDDLPSCLVEGVEGVEEFVLHLLLARDELHVVHEQQVRVAVFGAELAAAARAHELDEFVDEIIALDVDDLRRRARRADLMSDGVNEVRFAKAGVAVDK